MQAHDDDARTVFEIFNTPSFAFASLRVLYEDELAWCEAHDDAKTPHLFTHSLFLAGWRTHEAV